MSNYRLDCGEEYSFDKQKIDQKPKKNRLRSACANAQADLRLYFFAGVLNLLIKEHGSNE